MRDTSSDPDDGFIMLIAALRIAVGFLGERDNAGWWSSGFLSPTSNAFLAPVFGPNILQARYQGVRDAAKRIHDERIGVGHVFHLFRLPESMEQRLFEAVQLRGPELNKMISSSDAANLTLDSLVNKPVAAKPGPALIASSEALDSIQWIGDAASLYSAAFGAGEQCFPYIAGAR